MLDHHGSKFVLLGPSNIHVSTLTSTTEVIQSLIGGVAIGGVATFFLTQASKPLQVGGI
jgi:hypothetical protein